MPVDKHIRRMMQDLGQALAQAIASSSRASDAVRQIREEGYSIFLVLNRKQEGERGVQIELTSHRATPREPAFLLDKRDVSFLKTVGIDATRAGKRRRTP